MILPITAHAVQELLARGDVEVIDVREAHEWATGHIAGARRVALNELRNNPQAALLRDSVVFVCAAGVRSETAARIAVAHGLTRVYNMTSGMRGWVRAGLPVALPELAAAV